jgi:hypothetical protein
MTQVLISIAHGGSWPVCPQAPIADSGSQPYTCPAGAQNMSVAASPEPPDVDGRGMAIPSYAPPQYVADPNGAFCGTSVAAAASGGCPVGASQVGVDPENSGGAISCLSITEATPNPTPDYIDFSFSNSPSGTAATRVWFNAARYQ